MKIALLKAQHSFIMVEISVLRNTYTPHKNISICLNQTEKHTNFN